jgi:septal ring factor EnvC (AmiA/AmiB activator)
LTEPQTWIMIGVVLATLVSTVVAMVHLLTRTMTAQFESFRREIGAAIAGLRAESNIRFETIERGFAEVDRRFDRVDTRLDRQEAGLDRVEAGVQALDNRVGDLDRDVQALTRKQFGSDLREA